MTNTPSSQSDLCLCCSLAAKSSFLAAISHYMNFSKDLVLKSDGRNSVFPNRIFLFKNCRRHLPYSSFQDLLAVLLGSSWCADICGCVFWFGSSKREPLLGNIAWDKTGFFKKQKWLNTRDFDAYRISNASLCILCVRATAAKSGFLAKISHKVKFSKPERIYM